MTVVQRISAVCRKVLRGWHIYGQQLLLFGSSWLLGKISLINGLNRKLALGSNADGITTLRLQVINQLLQLSLVPRSYFGYVPPHGRTTCL